MLASICKPEHVYHYIQLLIVSAFFISKATKRNIENDAAVIVYVLHIMDCYDARMEIEQLASSIHESIDNGSVESFNFSKLDKSINDLLGLKIIDMENENIWLNEKVWGNL